MTDILGAFYNIIIINQLNHGLTNMGHRFALILLSMHIPELSITLLLIAILECPSLRQESIKEDISVLRTEPLSLNYLTYTIASKHHHVSNQFISISV